MGISLTPDQAAEHLRLTLPLLSRYNISASPRNYAVWFDYVSGTNDDLCAEIDAIIAAEKPFTDAVNGELYAKYLGDCDIGEVEQLRKDVVRLLQEISQFITEAGRNVGNFHGQLVESEKEIDAANEIQGLRSMINSLLSETKSMQSTTQGIRDHIDVKSAEIESLRAELVKARKMAASDALTGIANRKGLFDAIDATRRRTDGRDTATLVLIDIDNFKRVNDTFGHLIVIGDRVIKFIAKTLVKHTRGSDTPARFGGEEFAVLLPETPLNGAMAVAENLRRAVADAKLVRADTKAPLGQVTISAGVAVYRDGEDVMDFIERADRALYASKRSGRNRITAESELPEQSAASLLQPAKTNQQPDNLSILTTEG